MGELVADLMDLGVFCARRDYAHWFTKHAAVEPAQLQWYFRTSKVGGGASGNGTSRHEGHAQALAKLRLLQSVLEAAATARCFGVQREEVCRLTASSMGFQQQVTKQEVASGEGTYLVPMESGITATTRACLADPIHWEASIENVEGTLKHAMLLTTEPEQMLPGGRGKAWAKRGTGGGATKGKDGEVSTEVPKPGSLEAKKLAEVEALTRCATPLVLSPSQMDMVEQTLLDRYSDSISPDEAANFVELFASPAPEEGGDGGSGSGHEKSAKDVQETGGDYAVFYACTRIVDLH
jgi:hypothetical protein